MVKNLVGKNIEITTKTLIIMINKVNVLEYFEYLPNKQSSHYISLSFKNYISNTSLVLIGSQTNADNYYQSHKESMPIRR